MKRFTSLINRSKSPAFGDARAKGQSPNYHPDSPEGTITNAVRLFCESGGSGHAGDEIAFLPTIVDTAESSPAAATCAAQQIRTFLGKSYQNQPYLQYNAIMLIRILSDHPGTVFTRNLDKNFVAAVKELLRTGKEQETQRMLRETLDSLEASRPYDQDLQLLLVMWRKEKGRAASFAPTYPQRPPRQPIDTGMNHQRNGTQGELLSANALGGAANGRRSGGRALQTLPPPVELAGRIEEARNTAKILLQLIQSTPSDEVLQNELVREFSERCQSAQRSMQGYINADNPPPDHDTMQTLIETNEQLSLAMSRHQRALLAARRALGATPSPNAEAMPANEQPIAAPIPRNSYPVTVPFSAFSATPHAPSVSSNGYEDHNEDNRNGFSAFAQRPVSPPEAPIVQHSDPFADPAEHEENPAPLAIEPTHYGASMNSTSYPPTHRQNQPSQTFSIVGQDSTSYAPYPEHSVHPNGPLSHGSLTPVSQPSPVMSRATRTSETSPSLGVVSPADSSYAYNHIAPPASPPRPGPGPWHQSDITPSFMHRQSSAANGITMHGAGVDTSGAVEIDGHSQVGRRDRDLPAHNDVEQPRSTIYPDAVTPPQQHAHHLSIHSQHQNHDDLPRLVTGGEEDEDDGYSNSRPSSHRYSRVDVAGTGGLKSPTSPTRSTIGSVFRH